MSQRTRGEWLDGDSRILECPGLAHAIDNRRRIVRAAVSVEETALRFQDLFRRRPADCREGCGDDGGFGGGPRLKWLYHRAEVFGKGGGMAGGNPESAGRLDCIQPFKLGAGGGCAESAARPRGMKTILIVAGGESPPPLFFPLSSPLVGGGGIPPPPSSALSPPPSGREHTNPRVDHPNADTNICVD